MPGVAVPEARMTVERVVLMRSDRGKDGMIYTEVGR
jgi:2'-5' RNA ligase